MVFTYVPLHAHHYLSLGHAVDIMDPMMRNRLKQTALAVQARPPGRTRRPYRHPPPAAAGEWRRPQRHGAWGGPHAAAVRDRLRLGRRDAVAAAGGAGRGRACAGVGCVGLGFGGLCGGLGRGSCAVSAFSAQLNQSILRCKQRRLRCGWWSWWWRCW